MAPSYPLPPPCLLRPTLPAPPPPAAATAARRPAPRPAWAASSAERLAALAHRPRPLPPDSSRNRSPAPVDVVACCWRAVGVLLVCCCCGTCGRARVLLSLLLSSSLLLCLVGEARSEELGTRGLGGDELREQFVDLCLLLQRHTCHRRRPLPRLPYEAGGCYIRKVVAI